MPHTGCFKSSTAKQTKQLSILNIFYTFSTFFFTFFQIFFRILVIFWEQKREERELRGKQLVYLHANICTSAAVGLKEPVFGAWMSCPSQTRGSRDIVVLRLGVTVPSQH